ncbi:MAG: hypothetical protein HZC01_04105 [Candidatus Kerfeldbacteria bacterium]|nr:hypothetical protein [Candidatus Kerfeldbacteria bacterium]
MRNLISKPLCWLLCCLLLVQPMISCNKKPTEPEPKPEPKVTFVADYNLPLFAKKLSSIQLQDLGTDPTVQQVQQAQSLSKSFEFNDIGMHLNGPEWSKPCPQDGCFDPPCEPSLAGRSLYHYNCIIYIKVLDRWDGNTPIFKNKNIANIHLYQNPDRPNCWGAVEYTTGYCISSEKLCGKPPHEVFIATLQAVLERLANIGAITLQQIDDARKGLGLTPELAAVILIVGLVSAGYIAVAGSLLSAAGAILVELGISTEAAGGFAAVFLVGININNPPETHDPLASINEAPTICQVNTSQKFVFSGQYCEEIAISYDGGYTVEYFFPQDLPKTTWHTFNSAGTYEIRNTAYGNGKWSPTVKRYVTVTDPVTNLPPVSNPSCPGTAIVNQPVSVTNNATDADGTVTEYRWRGEFGNFTTTTKQTNVTFTSTGTKVVYMSAKDDDGAWGQEPFCTIDVSSVVINQPPVACFSASPASGTTETTFNLDADCSTDDKTPLANLQVRWQIDGSWTGFTTTKTISKKWSTYGTKTVIVEVKDGDGLTDQETKTIQVDNPGPTTGTIEVSPNPSTASWDITPGGYTGSGYQSIPNVAPGEYHITWHSLSGYETPAGEYKTLQAGKTITFSVNYTPSSTPIDFTPTSIPDATLLQYYEVTFVSTGGTPGYGVAFSLSGSLPGLSFRNNADGTATLYGTPNVLGSYPITITVVDKGNLQNKKWCDYTLVVKSAVGKLVVDPAVLNMGSDLSLAYSTASNANNNGPITFSLSSNQTWLTTFPSSVGTTTQEIKVMVSRSGLSDGQYNGRITLSSSGGTAYIDVEMTVATGCVMSPDMISPINGQNLDLTDPVFSWSKVCQEAGKFYAVIVKTESYYGDVVFFEDFDYRDTYVRYTGSSLQTYRTYYWFLTDAYGTPVTGIESFYVIP